MIGEIILALILIVLNGFFALSEVAILGVNQSNIKNDAENGNKKAKAISDILENPSNFLATMQIGVTFSNLLLGVITAEYFIAYISNTFFNYFSNISYLIINIIVIILSILVMSYISLVFGELVPKRIAINNADILAYKTLWFVIIITKILKPFVKLLSLSTHFLIGLVGIDPNKDEDNLTEEEIRLIMDASGESGSIDEDELEMINNIFEFNDKTVGEIATHRTDLVSFDLENGIDELKNFILKEKYSRIPVYEENIDNIVGILHMKDLLRKMITCDNLDIKDVKDILREPFFVPLSKKTDVLFEEMQKNKVHLSVVLDEYGGTLGIVTMEDLVESVMGNIFDEHDIEEEPDIEIVNESTYIVNGSANLEDVSHETGIELPDDEHETLAGFLIGQLGRIPYEDEQPEIEFGGLLFKVFKVEERRITSVVICKLNNEEKS